VSGDADSLPTLLSRAGQRLLYARTSAQVLEAKKIAELALHYAKVTNAANETHADCLRIITRAEMRMRRMRWIRTRAAARKLSRGSGRFRPYHKGTWC
jgi:hypothetical protein